MKGISAKTQELYVVIFCLRYLDLFMYFVSWYNTIMKIAFIASTVYTVYLIKWKKPYASVPPPAYPPRPTNPKRMISSI